MQKSIIDEDDEVGDWTPATDSMVPLLDPSSVVDRAVLDAAEMAFELVEDEEETEDKKRKKTRFQEESQEDEEDSYSRDDILAWLGKGPGKGKN